MNVDANKVINSLSLKIAELVKTLTILEVENAELREKVKQQDKNETLPE